MRQAHCGVFSLLLLGLLLACTPDESTWPEFSPVASGPEERGIGLSVNSFLYQLQAVDLGAIAETAYDLIIMDYSSDGSDAGEYTADEIAALQHSPGGPKIVLAYLSIGEAEDYRFYWDANWDANRDGQPDPGSPAWLEDVNPDWEGNYKVRYWDPGWQAILFGSSASYLDRILAAGFDGVYLDIVDAYEYFEERGQTSAAREMADLVLRLAAYARARRPGFLVFPQNASDLAALYPDYLAALDGIGQEDIYYGYPEEGDPSPPDFLAEVEPNLDLFVAWGKTVLVTAYTMDRVQIDDHYARAAARGYIPFATVRGLDLLTVNPGHEP
jgi:cysteinyl-tRNA synthetase